MSNPVKRKPYKRIALALSLCAIFIWAILGTGASLAWFTDTSEEVNNIFHFANFELAVSHRTDEGKWESIDGKTDIFDDDALYEPGYVQVVYLKIENKGDRAFDFYTAVSVTDYTAATNVYGQHFLLQDYLKFGIAVAETEAEMNEKVATRAQANEIATMKLSRYETDVAALGSGETAYMALVVRMP